MLLNKYHKRSDTFEKIFEGRQQRGFYSMGLAHVTTRDRLGLTVTVLLRVIGPIL